MKNNVIYLFVMFSLSLGHAQIDSLFISEIKPTQKEIIAKLTGKKPIEKDIYLNQRATSKERQLTVDYLSNYLIAIGWKLENHHYKVSNGNPFIDLLFKPNKGVNVAAVLPSTIISNKYVVFGAHYDSERGSPGAIDNATGIALSLGVAQKLKDLKVRNINFLVVFFDQEEDNEIGSKAYAKMLKKSGREVHSVHTLDMIGWDENNNKSLELELPSSSIEKLYTVQAEKFNIPVYTTKVNSSDHKSFIDQGFNALGISEEYVRKDTTPFYHTEKDTYNTVNFDYLAHSTAFIYHIFKTIAK